MHTLFRACVLIFLLCPLIIAGQHIPSQNSSSVSITMRVFSSFDSSAVKNYTAALYDDSGSKIDSLVATDTNVITFLNVPITGINPSHSMPAGYFLGQSYPNPFNPSTRIQFAVPKAEPVSFMTYTILGQEDASLEMTLEPGSYEVEYRPGGGAGVVFYRMTTKDFSETKKMIQFGGEKPGRSSLMLVSSGLSSRSQQSCTAADVQANDFVVKLHNLPSTSLPMQDTSIQIGGLMRDTTVKIFVIEAKGLPCPSVPTVSYAGKTYNTVLIGTQCWLKENLDVGTRINGSNDQTNNGTIEKYCYSDDTTNCQTYGGLYQWDEAMQYSTTEGAKGICPSGWHIPTYREFQTLASEVSSDGNALKAVGQGSGGGAGTNTSGFSALLAGFRYYSGRFYDLGSTTYVWSSSVYPATYPFAYYLYLSGSGNIDFDYYDTVNGFYVRCVQD